MKKDTRQPSTIAMEVWARTHAAKYLGSKGGIASAKKLTPQQRTERATKAVQAREAKRAKGGSAPHTI